ncbi:hypothetical protein FA95DRAFT_1556988 [Auriscalpium vulgare]|uniref:Uncharacterized protein n=1 Tax=Auriscalpium vulgare TaxID=40419 RepID=A0ACB8S0E1_9AGAM|nr:hypothetical protein FA95DRAFT_1556988 [Auriscalpium vulgare]
MREAANVESWVHCSTRSRSALILYVSCSSMPALAYAVLPYGTFSRSLPCARSSSIHVDAGNHSRRAGPRLSWRRRRDQLAQGSSVHAYAYACASFVVANTAIVRYCFVLPRGQKGTLSCF